MFTSIRVLCVYFNENLILLNPCNLVMHFTCKFAAVNFVSIKVNRLKKKKKTTLILVSLESFTGDNVIETRFSNENYLFRS